MATKNNPEIVEVKNIEIKRVNVRIRGTAPLISHKWSFKAKKMILDKQTEETKVTKKHDKKIPALDFISSAYWLTEEPTGDSDEECIANFEKAVKNGARWGFPATAFKQAAIMAASRNNLDMKGTQIRAAFFIEGEGRNSWSRSRAASRTSGRTWYGSAASARRRTSGTGRSSMTGTLT